MPLNTPDVPVPYLVDVQQLVLIRHHAHGAVAITSQKSVEVRTSVS